MKRVGGPLRRHAQLIPEYGVPALCEHRRCAVMLTEKRRLREPVWASGEEVRVREESAHPWAVSAARHALARKLAVGVNTVRCIGHVPHMPRASRVPIAGKTVRAGVCRNGRACCAIHPF